MKNLIHSCDFMGFSPSLHIYNKKIHQSTFTGILSILIILISLLCVGYFGSDLYLRQTPLVVVTHDDLDDFGPYNISNKEFMPMIAMYYSNSTGYVDPTIFEVTASILNIIYEKNNSTAKLEQVFTISDLEIDICTKYYTKEDLIEQNMHADLNIFYCTKPGMAKLSGFWGTYKEYNQLNIFIKNCVKSTKNNFHWKSIEKIDEQIQNGLISTIMTNYEPDQKNYTEPLKRVFIEDYNLLNAVSSLEYSFDLIPYIFKSDNGIIFPDEHTYEGFTNKQTIFFRNIKSENIVSFTYQGNSVASVFLRSYTKLQTVVTQIGGFIKAIMLIASVIANVFSKNFYFSQILFDCGKNETKLNEEYKGVNNLSSSIQNSRNNSIIFQKNEKNDFTQEIGHKNLMTNNYTGKIVKNEKTKIFTKLEKNSKKHEVFEKNVNIGEKNTQQENNLYKEKLLPNDSVINLLFGYFFSNLLFCKKPKDKNYSYRLLESTSNLYRNVTSVNTLLEKVFDIEFIKYNCKFNFKNESKVINIRDEFEKIIIKTIKSKSDLNNEIIRKHGDVFTF